MQTTTTLRTRPARRHTATLVALLALGCLMLPAPPARAADAPKSWSGTWNNRKFNTTGALTCTVTSEKADQWQVKFSGTGLGKPFSYDATLTAKTSGARTTLSGTTQVDGERYQWSGAITGQTLVGNYRSTTGNNGEFRLQARK